MISMQRSIVNIHAPHMGNIAMLNINMAMYTFGFVAHDTTYGCYGYIVILFRSREARETF